ncbi:FAD-dependent monooxygenase [Streptomyces sp. cg28]|uniref:FAD-dependent monooxygenase n=1 Tax=Streptomyces sp. cg28 TaxID=3403457 RepID=UPI003B2165AE
MSDATEVRPPVLVVGAGPSGLMTAVELALQRVPVIVVDRKPGPGSDAKGGGVNARTCEVLDLRGLGERARARSVPRDTIGGHFAALPVILDATRWNTRRNGGMLLPQNRMEALLRERLRELGVQVDWGCEITALTERDDRLAVTLNDTNGERVLHCAYLAACDGPRSTVRALTGLKFPGTARERWTTAADIELAAASASVQRQLTHISRQMAAGGGYQMMLHTLGEDSDHLAAQGSYAGAYRLLFTSPQEASDPALAVTAEEVQQALTAVHGPETRLHRLRSASRFSDAARLMDTYRHGRILFAGDAAHIHPPNGGQGLNLGLQDAVNLGWKIAAALRAPEAAQRLLDSYDAERRPVARRVIEVVQAQTVLMPHSELSTQVTALRAVVAELASTDDANHLLAGRMSGLDIRYPMACAHPLSGMRMPDLTVATADRQRRVSEVLRAGRGALLSFDDATASPPAPPGLPVLHGTVVPSPAGDTTPARHALVRPDGYVCWAGDLPDASLGGAVAHWFPHLSHHIDNQGAHA